MRHVLSGLLLLPMLAWAHGGGLNAEGCHNNHKTGDYHCHRTPPSKPVQNTQPAAATAQQDQPVCYTGPKGGTYTITPSGKKNYKRYWSVIDKIQFT